MQVRFYFSIVLFTLFTLSFNKIWATHIVGGTLTYVYNGGNNYTITCKLYRDCSPGTWPMPNSILVNVRGLNGATFTPTRDIVLPRISITPVPPSLDSCAIRPNPEPCVEEGLFRLNVNLPPSIGGYHLYVSMLARNLTLTNINSSGNNIGETFYCFIPPPTTVWLENFTLPNGTTIDNGATAWNIQNGATPPNTAAVNGNTFQATGSSNGSVWWISQPINISSYTGNIQLSADLFENGTLNSNDSILLYYSVDGGPLIPFSFNGAIADDFTSATAFTNGITGNTVRIYIKIVFSNGSNNSKVYGFDNVGVYFISMPNSNPTFNLFPPLYLCLGQRFEFDHSASDLDGDSLVYSFYTPFNGYNASGNLVTPTYVNNTPQFTQVIYLSGYGTTNPLGGNALTLNAQTGLLSGIPTQLGQFVVGIKVSEYRDGVLISETYRDFQFNVINCPATRKAVLTEFRTCVGTKVNFTSATDTTQTTYWWNFGDPTTTADTSIKYRPTYIYPSIGTYTVTLIVNKGTVCEDSTTAPVYVGWTKAYFKKSTSQCIGYPIQFTDSSTFSANSTAATYSWNFGNGTTSTLQNPTCIYTTPGTYTVTLTVTSTIGCTSTYTQTVTVGPAPLVNAGPDQTVCSSNPAFILNGSITNANGGIWSSTGTGTFSSTTNLTGVTYTPSAADISAGQVKIILTSVSNSVCVITDTVVVNIVASPTTANAGANQIICGTSTTILNGNVPSIGYGTWTTTSSTTILNPTSPSTQVTGLIAGNTYYYTWTINNGSACQSTSVVKVQVDDLPTTAQAGNDQMLCDVTSTVLSANIPLVGNGTWSIVSGTATINQPNNPNTTITNLIKGDTVILRWTIAQGVCKNVDDVKIIVNLLPVVNAGQEQTLCNQNPVIALNGTINNALGGYWSGGGGNYIPNNQTTNASYYPTQAEINAGSITLTLNSLPNGACPSVSNTVKINFKPFNGNVTINATSPLCTGQANGSATASISGGSGSYTFTWNTVPAQYTSTATNLTQGNYTVLVKDNLGCVASSTIQINDPQPLTALIQNTPVSCNGGNNGTATITPQGGTGNYTYSWWPVNSNSATVNNLLAGTYNVEVTDANGCKKTQSVTITQPNPLLVSTNTVNNVSCNGGNNGSISLTVLGGVSPYSYSWNTPNGFGSTANNLTAGNYTVTVTDFNGCTYTHSVTVNQPNALNGTIALNHLSCYQNNTGSATATLSGGVAPYQYSWGPNLNSNSSQITNLPAGNYYLTVKDQNNCEWFQPFTITQPNELIAQVAGVKNVSCFNGANGSILINAIGGTGNYTFSWTPNVSTTNYATNLSSGNYSIVITDQNGCSKTVNQTIQQPSQLLLSENHTNPTCYGYNNGQIQTIATGGTPPYSYSWSVPGVGNQSSYNYLTTGNYTIFVTDTLGCSQNIAVLLTEPSKINISSSSSSSTCGLANGSANVSATGGSGNYTYSWIELNQTTASVSNVAAGFYTVYVFDNTGCFDSIYVLINDIAGPTISINSITNATCYGANNGSATVTVTAGTPPFSYTWSTTPNQNLPTATNLAPGAYAVSVTDSNGCSTSAITTPPITQPDSISFQYTVQNILCNGASTGSITITPTGGTPPYNVQWTNPLITSNSINNLSQGTYTFTITDFNNCSYTSSVSLNEPPPLNTSLINVSDVTCFNAHNGSAQIAITGGTLPYTYSWSGSSSIGTLANDLDTGTHWVYVTDGNSCTDSLNFYISQPTDTISAQLNITNATCFGFATGAVSITASGGNGNYSYTWLPANINGNNISNLPAGTYVAIVTDAKGCTESFTFNIQQPEILSANIQINSSTCGYNNGTIYAMGIGGNGNYQYSWQPGNLTGNFQQNLQQGNYYLTIVDSLGCIYKDTIALSNIPGPEITQYFTTPASCFGFQNGSASITVNAVATPLSYTWLPAVSNDSIAQNLAAGNYQIIVNDLNHCSDTINITITQPTPLKIDTISVNDVLCKGQNNGSALAFVSGGTLNYSYSWSFTNLDSTFVQNIPPGQHSLTVTDNNNCIIQTSFTVNEPAKLTVTPATIVNATCSGYSDGSISLNVTGGNYPYTYSWSHSTGTNSSYVQGLEAGHYFVMVTDSKGCFDTLSLTIEEPATTVVVISNKPTICLGQTATLTAQAYGGNGPPYTFNWQPIAGVGNTLTVSPTQTETYYVVAYDKKGCISNVEAATVTVYSLFAGDIDIIMKNPICKGTSTTITAVSNGNNTGPLTYTWNQGLGYGPGPFTITPTAPGVYQVTVSTVCGTTVIVRDTLKFIPPPKPGFKADSLKGCYPLLVNFTDTSIQNPNDPAINWIWNFGDGTSSTDRNPTHIYYTPGTYYVTLNVQTLEGCNVISPQNAVKIVVHPHPTAAFTPNPQYVYTPYGTVYFNNQSKNATSYLWDFGNGITSTVSSPTYTYTEVGTYTITLISTDKNGCKDTITKEIIVSGDFIMPNAFTPNPDGPNGGVFDPTSLDNDVFNAYAKGVKEYKLHIFNRWGELIFESTDPKIGWDGYYREKLCQAGVYIWQVYIKFLDDREFKKVGDVNLIR